MNRQVCGILQPVQSKQVSTSCLSSGRSLLRGQVYGKGNRLLIGNDHDHANLQLATVLGACPGAMVDSRGAGTLVVYSSKCWPQEDMFAACEVVNTPHAFAPIAAILSTLSR